MKKHKRFRISHFLESLCRRHHFATPNTAEVIFSILFMGLIARLLSLLERH